MGWTTYVKRVIEGRLARKEAVYIPLLRGKLLQGQRVLVTGGSSGIGLAIANAFLENGSSVMITGRHEERLNRAAEQLTECHGRRVFGLTFDASSSQGYEKLVGQVESSLGGGITVLVNNVGTNREERLGALTPEGFDAVMEVNLRGTILLSQAVAKSMIRNGIEGNILNISSSAGLRPATSAYDLSKWGMRGLTLGMAKALIAYGIVVNGIAPGPTATSMLGRDVSDITRESSPVGRLVTPQEIANMAVVLTSAMGRTVVGDILYMTGGCGVVTYDDVDCSFVV